MDQLELFSVHVNLSGQDLTSSLSNTVNNADLRGFPAWGVNLSNANLSDLHIPESILLVQISKILY